MKKHFGASEAAVQRHYDVGNNFYRLWLDRNMVYSSAFWEEGDTLESAQMRKIDYHIEQAHAAGKNRVLDIGCGWGAMLYRLVGHYGIERAVGLTLSNAQAMWISERPNPRIELRVENWQDHMPAEPYDAIISIGAFEHFAKPEASEAEKIAGYRKFFRRCHEILRPGGRLSIQTITAATHNERKIDDDPVSRIFPESAPPLLSEIATASEDTFEIIFLRNDREHYERTLNEWKHALEANAEEARKTAGEKIYTDYRRYLTASRAYFALGKLNLLRIAFRRIDRPAQP